MYALDVICFDERFRFSRSAMLKFAEAKKARVAIAEDGETIAGFAIVHLERVLRVPVAYVVTLDVAPEFRRQGVAGELMLRLEEEARSAGCVEMVLHVFPGNGEAIRFYERAGYERSGVARKFYGAAGDAWVYRRQLRES